MKKTITLIIILIMTFFLNAQLQNNSGISPIKKSVTNEEIVGKQKNFITEIQKATTHGNFFSDKAKLYSSFVSMIKTLETKSNSTTQPLLDSIVTKNTSGITSKKEAYYYDSNGLLISFESYSWLAGIYRTGLTKYANTYNSNKEVLVNTIYQWDMASSSWILSTQSENSYDANKNLTTTIDYSRDATLNVWDKYAKSELSYNLNNNLLLETNYSWNNSTGLWINSAKNDHKINALGKDTLVVESLWDSISSSWKTDSKTRYVYDSKTNLTGFENWNWDSATNTWVDVVKQDLAYDANSLLISSVTSFWDSGTSTWTGLEKSTISYYSNHLEQFIITYNPSGNSWIANTESESIYDGNNNKTIENSYTWNINTSTWVKTDISTYYYTFISTYNPTLSGTGIVVYPNPVSTELQITGLITNSDIAILDIQGKIVYTQKYIGKTIDVSSLKEGIYILQITNSTGRANYKFIKIHTK